MAGGTVLIADDDSAIRTVLNQAFARAGYLPRATGNAATLWRWVSQGEGDVVITDVVMPDENAFDLIPRIKKVRPDLPIIVFCALMTSCCPCAPPSTLRTHHRFSVRAKDRLQATLHFTMSRVAC